MDKKRNPISVKSLNIFSGSKHDIRYTLWEKCLLEHIDGPKNTRTVFIECDTSFQEIKSRIDLPLSRGKIVAAIERIETPEVLGLVLDLMASGNQVLAGILCDDGQTPCERLMSMLPQGISLDPSEFDVVYINDETTSEEFAKSRINYLSTASLILNEKWTPV